VDISTLRGVGINSIDNVMTLLTVAHKVFSELQLALAAPDVSGKYKVVTFGKTAPTLEFPKTVIGRSATGQPLPNLFYPTIHCAICKVLWASVLGMVLGMGFQHGRRRAPSRRPAGKPRDYSSVSFCYVTSVLFSI